MKRIELLQQLMNHMKQRKSVYLFVSILFLMGIIFGAFLVNSISLTQRHDLFLHLSQFFHEMNNGHIEATANELFVNSIVHYSKYIGLLWILGISMIGLPIIFILLFMKGIVIGFTVGFLVNQMGAQGFVIAFVTVFPQNIILIPVFIAVGCLSVRFCIRLFKHTFMKGIHEPIFPHFLSYTVTIVCLLAVTFIAALFESYVAPSLLKWTLSLF
ncbi:MULTISPECIES: stage II sporulation protein M [Shouchella]|uniref:Stage II sporulation protein M n=3 Tax=Bacillaceae TaxID=186817 RepID=A0A060LVC8_9BACI|nr:MULTISPECIES: stage II sporulation protein M [Bacillaceae]RQW20084.1 stage II sporulation protein M [Bacillus sp. C1-1]AIC94172.1 Stage II sporulation protein M [Shouchella lehensis G1]KQL57910.1 stage II sporulation protein M [Alkalicoccobacillus plakortidis]MBG9785793.1 stage II sporulation protein M [Shouchella lehensis]TES48262.1 stage II sporulation protein M [Shouchella lehensis]